MHQMVYLMELLLGATELARAPGDRQPRVQQLEDRFDSPHSPTPKTTLSHNSSAIT